MIVKTIDTNQCGECDGSNITHVFALRPDGNKLAFWFEDEDVPDFFKDKTSYTYEQFIAMTKDTSNAWYTA